MSKGSNHRLYTVVWLCSMLILGVYVAKALNMITDVAQFLPTDNKQPYLRVLQNQLASTTSSILLLGIKADTPEEMRRLSHGLKAALQSDAGVIQSIYNGEAQPAMAEAQTLAPYRYLLTDQDWSAQGIADALKKRLAQIQLGAGPIIGERMLHDPFFAMQSYYENIYGQRPIQKLDEVWFDKESGALLIIKLATKSLDLDVAQQAIDQIENAFQALQPSADATLIVTGPAAIAVLTRDNIKTTIQQVTWVLVGMLVLVFWLGYRNLKLLAMAGVPLASGLLAGMAATQLVFGSVHAIVIAFGVTILGMCLDYPLHLFSHCNRQETPQATLTRIWPTLRLGGFTSVIAYLVLLGSGFEGLSQLAVFSATGLLAALWVTKILLPNWIRSDKIFTRSIRLRQILAPRAQLLLISILTLLILFAWYSEDRIWNDNVDSISPVPAAARQQDTVLRNKLSAMDVSQLFVVEANTVEQALEKTETLVKKLQPLVEENIVNRIVAVSDVIPSQHTQALRRQKIPEREILQAVLQQAVTATPFKAQAFTPFVDEAQVTRTLDLLTPNNLPDAPMQDLVSNGLIKTPTGWLSVIRLAGIRSNERLADWIAGHPGLQEFHLQIKNTVSELLRQYRQAAVEKFALALLLLPILLWFGIRHVRKTLHVITPVILSVAITLLLPVVFGTGLTIFHVLAAVLVMGMGLDYSLFMNRKEASQAEAAHSLFAITVSAITTVGAFSVMAFSAVPILMAMGMVIAIGVTLCYVFALLFYRYT